jgi:hypothetical protein
MGAKLLLSQTQGSVSQSATMFATAPQEDKHYQKVFKQREYHSGARWTLTACGYRFIAVKFTPEYAGRDWSWRLITPPMA